jgi:tripartite-type tricarboxylate transporter receptor subunit TctC
MSIASRFIALAIGFACAHLHGAEAYPTRPVRIIAPFPAGSGVDIVARMVGTPLAQALGQPVVVDNRPGANGTIACDLAAKAAPDGYTLLLANASTLAMAPSLYRNVPYDPVKSFAPITLITTSANVLVVHPSVPASTTAAFIALARAKPGQLNYGSAGAGNSTHLAAELFRMMAGVDLVHVPYKGTPPMLAELLTGQIQLSFTSLVSALPHVKQSRLRALGVTSLKRAASMPDVPTIHESGLKGYEVTVWQGIVAPARTPETLVARLNTEVTRIVESPEIRDRFLAQGLDPAAGKPAAFGAYIAAEAAKWAKVIRHAGIQPE